MNSYERFFRRMAGEPVDRLPNMNIVMQFASHQMGLNYGKMVSDYRVLADCVANCYEKFHIDCLWTVSDPMREAEGFGADVVIPEDGVPYSRVPRIRDVSDIKTLKVIDPSKGKRMTDRVEAVRLLKRRFTNEAPVIGWVEGSFAEACDLTTVSEMLLLLYDEPEAASELLSICLEQGKLFAKAQVEAGADIVGVGDAATSLIGPELYKQFAFPYQKELIEYIHGLGSKVKLHICGNITHVLDMAIAAKPDILDLDYMVDIEKAAKLAGDISVCGNFDPVAVLMQGSVRDVREATRRCAELGVNNNIVAAGCEVPVQTPPENLLAVYEELCAL